MNRTRNQAVALVALAVVAAGCADAQSTKAGGARVPLTLRLGTEGGQGRPEADQMEEFARQVEQLSGGDVTIEPVWEAGRMADGESTPGGADQAVAVMVQDGELDMGMIPARAWDTMGVSSMQALTAPFLVTTNELTTGVTGGDFAEDMLAGLDDIGITGLALFPDALRHLFAFGDPILAPADVADKKIRALPSDATYALIEALGAEAVDVGGSSFSTAVASGEIVAAESSFALASATLPALGTATGNLTLFPKVNSLVIDSDVFDDMSGDRQEVLREAALAAREWAVANAVSDVDEASAFCERGGAVVLATDEELAAFEDASQHVYAALEQDDTTKALIERIRELKTEMPASTVPEPCGSEPETTITTTTSTIVDAGEEATATFPAGVYRMEITGDVLVEAGVDRATALGHAGTWTLTFGEDGTFSDGDCQGATYSVEGDRVVIQMGPGPGCGTAANMVLFTSTWSVDGDELLFTDVQSGSGFDPLIETLFGTLPWTRIG
jgi:TRAP-type C4-dicarboxylate transport system substrate-binding protein